MVDPVLKAPAYMIDNDSVSTFPPGGGSLKQILVPCEHCCISQDDRTPGRVHRPVGLLQWLDGMADQTIRRSVIKPLHGLRVACQGGCRLREGARAERIAGLQRVIRLLGGEPMECEAPGAEILCVACPTARGRMNGNAAELRLPAETTLPVLFLTQVIGLAMGFAKGTLGIVRQRYLSAEPVLCRIGNQKAWVVAN